jgi:protease-4
MRKFIGRVLAWIGGIVVCLVILIFVIATFARSTKGKVPARAILEINLETGLFEEAPDDPFLRLYGQNVPGLRDIVEALEKAKDDTRVAGMIARIGAAPISLAQAQEIRDAVASFREKKKFAVAFSETFGEFGPGNGAYYLSTAFDEIWLQPSGDIGLTGLSMESLFLRGTFDKLGLVPRFDQRYEYKNAMNTYTEKKFTPAHREAMDGINRSFFSQLVRGIAKARKLSEDQVKSIIDRAPLLGMEALQAKLVDGVAYRDEVFAKVRGKAGSDAEFLYANKYLDRAGRPHSRGSVVALIFGSGAVVRGKSEVDPFSVTPIMGSETVAGAFRQAVKDQSVKAILFRVDSPGGSYVASDTIWREVVNAKKAGKPVIVSMSSVAGSGGYFVAMAADKIVAQPATITGSIGVLAGKLLSTGFWDKLGISWDEVHAGKNARMFTGLTDYSKEEWARFQAALDRIYEDFTSKVAEGRKLPKEKVLQIAKGRIWSGEDAKANGLIDELGGYPVAIRLVKSAINVKDTDSIQIRVFPRKKTTFEAISEKISGDEGESSESPAAILALRMAERVRPLVRLLDSAGLGHHSEVLSMPPIHFAK